MKSLVIALSLLTTVSCVSKPPPKPLTLLEKCHLECGSKSEVCAGVITHVLLTNGQMPSLAEISDPSNVCIPPPAK